jgi:DnaJ-class molecular chaperone
MSDKMSLYVKLFNLLKDIKCGDCDGKGAITKPLGLDPATDDWPICKNCKGTGIKNYHKWIIGNKISVSLNATCEEDL